MLATPEYSDADVIGNVFTMLFAGEDTTANTLAWATSHAGARTRRRRRACRRRPTRSLGADRTPQSAEAADAMRLRRGRVPRGGAAEVVAPIIFVEPIADTTVAGVELPAGTRVAA